MVPRMTRSAISQPPIRSEVYTKCVHIPRFLSSGRTMRGCISANEHLPFVGKTGMSIHRKASSIQRSPNLSGYRPSRQRSPWPSHAGQNPTDFRRPELGVSGGRKTVKVKSIDGRPVEFCKRRQTLNRIAEYEPKDHSSVFQLHSVFSCCQRRPGMTEQGRKP